MTDWGVERQWAGLVVAAVPRPCRPVDFNVPSTQELQLLGAFAQEIQISQQQTDTPQIKDTVETYAALPKELLSGVHHPPQTS